MEEHNSSQRRTGAGSTHHKHVARVSGRRLAAESALSRYLNENEQVYLYKGMANPAARRIKAKLDELGVK